MFLSDIEIAQKATMLPIESIAEKLDIDESHLELYGAHKAKVNTNTFVPEKKNGKLILVTAQNPTPYGEGKTTISVGLLDGLCYIGKNAAAALREPSLGPVFGSKGGATGGGYAQVVPMEDINLHFTGDIHAIGATNNLLAAIIDNHIYQGNALGIDPKRITWRRCVDMNDRQLRNIVDGLGARTDGVSREDGFDITVASEIMAVFCLAQDIEDLKTRLGNIVFGYTYKNEPLTVSQLGVQGAMAALLKDALKPNLVQTLAHCPVFIHGGPFANIAHGCNSVIATKLAMQTADYTVTEAGFGADLGAEKFLDIKCRETGIEPDCIVVVSTLRSLKYNAGVHKDSLYESNTSAITTGFANLKQHIENMQTVYQKPVVVSINKFAQDTNEELLHLQALCKALGVEAIITDAWAKGGQGCAALAETVALLCEKPSTLHFAYDLADSLEQKIESVARKIYHADDVEYMPAAKTKLKKLAKDGFAHLPICIAKTQYSFSDNPKLLGAPRGFTLTVRDAKVSAGAGFVVVFVGEILAMPGLPKAPAAEGIDVDSKGVITGLF